jgi:hypothetical protein
MEALRLLDAAPFAPGIVKILKQAFEEAWAGIGPTIPPDRVEDTRIGLVHAIVAHAATGDHDQENLKAAAIEAATRHPPRTASTDP